MAHPRHRRETSARRTLGLGVALGAPVAVGVTATAVTLGTAASGPAVVGVASRPLPTAAPVLDRGPTISRSDSRLDAALDDQLPKAKTSAATPDLAKLSPTQRLLLPTVTRAAVAQAHTHRWTTTDLNLWDGPGRHSSQVAELQTGEQVLVTGRSLLGRDEVVVHGQSRWVTAGYLTEVKPIAAAAGLSMAPCPDGGVEYRLTPGAVYVYRSVCHAFPQITTYGGWADRGEHSSGKALDIMTTDLALGNAIRAFLISHASELNLYDVIWQQHIWTPVRASEGFRLMPDRGSATANHYDHVHVSVN